MFKNGPCPDYEAVFLARVARAGLTAGRLSPQHTKLLTEIRSSCPACQDPSRCALDLAMPPTEWEDWDEYCPNAARLRVLAALTMFPESEVSAGS